jgi:hypothetical protein
MERQLLINQDPGEQEENNSLVEDRWGRDIYIYIENKNSLYLDYLAQNYIELCVV